MIKIVKYYACSKCGLKYKSKRLAKKCEEWCKKYKSCNLKIAKHAIKDTISENEKT